MSSLLLRGIEGANPLGFLAALGALRISQLVWREAGVGMRWIQRQGWQPELGGLPVAEEQELCGALAGSGKWAPLEEFSALGNNLTVKPLVYRPFVRGILRRASGEDSRPADFLAAFATDVLVDKDKDRIAYTDLCFITGSGHQHFLGTARGLADKVGREQLQEALFGPWRYADRSLSMRWDPTDAKEYALQWRDPSAEGVSSVWGASRLAFEALPLLPVVPSETGARTTGFETRNRAHEFTWPIWAQWASVDSVRSLIGAGELQEDPVDRGRLCQIGVAEVFRAQRVRIPPQGANFKVSFRRARAV
jgi:hypothetical protein